MQFQGLSQQEVAERQIKGGKNSLPADKSRRLLNQLWGVVREPMMLLLLAAALISVALGEPVEAGAMLVSVCFVVLISLVQVRRTDNALAALKVLSAPKATVLREGQYLQIPSEDVVIDDLIQIREGDRIPADCRIIEASYLLVDESILTGESLSVEKRIGELGLSGTLVVRGHGIARVEAIGSSSQLGKIGQLLVGQGKRTILQREIDSIVRIVSVLALATAATVSLVYALTRGEVLVGLLAGVAAAMALLPEELPIVLTMFLGLGAWRMAKSNVIVRSNPAIEMLGQISVLCVDKTGTITLNEMTLQSKDSEILKFGTLASIPNSFDPVDKAFLRESSPPVGLSLIKEFPLTEENWVFGQAWRDTDGSLIIAIKGAPEQVLSLCQLSSEEKDMFLAELEALAGQGMRILGIAKATADDSVTSLDSLPALNYEFVGFAQLKDPVREGVAGAISELQDAGVRTVMITGDHAQTAQAIASEIGLPNPAQAVQGIDLERLSKQEVANLVATKNVFSRVKPHQKLLLVQELQRQGQVVAMTGDGVNDAPALKAANVGIAMGMRGSEVAREAADLVIADDSFLSITEGVRAGRRIFGNLRKAAAYVIAIHIPIFGMALVPITSSVWPLVLLPIQIAILEIVIDPSASLAYESEKATKDQMARKPRPIGERFLTGEVLKMASIQGVILFAGTFASFLISFSMGYSEDKVRSVTFGTILLGNLLLMLANRSGTASLYELLVGRTNRIAGLIFGLGLLVMLVMFTIEPIRFAFNLGEIGLFEVAIIVFLSSPAILWFEIYKFRKRKSARA